MTKRALAPFLSVLVLVCFPLLARADVRAEARRQFREGMARIEAADYEPGVKALKAAYDLMPHPVVLFNIAKAYVELNRLAAAVEYFRRYLASDPDDAEEVQQTIANIEQRLRQIEVEAEAHLREANSARQAVSRARGLGATVRQIETLERALTQLEALAEASESVSLFEQVKDLNQVVADLRHGLKERKRKPAQPGKAVVAAPAGTATIDTTTTSKPGDKPTAASKTDVYTSKVVSASRFARTPLDAPNSTTIVTAQDIRLSGITNIPDLLRRNAGLEVMTLTPANTEVSIRGLNQRLSNKVLTLVNGRSVYLDFLGATLWSIIPITVEDIERIEIIRGPASAIYGADAVAGVINIVLREPGEGTSLILGGGGSDYTGHGAASLFGRSGPFSYRLSGGFKRTNQYSLMVDPARVDIAPYANDPTLGLQSGHFNGEMRWRPAKGWMVRGGTALSVNQLSFQATSRLRELYIDYGLFGQTYAQLDTPIGLSLRLYWNLWQNDGKAVNVAPGGVPLEFKGLTNHTMDSELTFADEFEFVVDHYLAAGVTYRLKYIDWAWIGPEKQEHHFSVFLEDTMRIGDHVLLALSGRLDHHPLLPNFLEVSPRAAVVIRPTEGIAIRALAGSAFRKPTFMESYLNLDNSTPVRGVTSFGIGNTELRPERLISFELGYSQEIVDIVSIEFNAYYNLVLDQVLLTRINRYTLSNYPGYSESTAGFPVAAVQFENEDAMFQQLGGEAGVRVNPIRGLDFYVNYSLHETWPFQADIDLAGREEDHRTSTHKINGGVQYRSTFGLDAAIDVHWVSEQIWVEQVTDERTGVRFEAFRLPDYLLLNARLGYRLFDDQLELGIVGTNLLNRRHRQHPFGQRIGLRVLGNAAVSF